MVFTDKPPVESRRLFLCVATLEKKFGLLYVAGKRAGSSFIRMKKKGTASTEKGAHDMVKWLKRIMHKLQREQFEVESVHKPRHPLPVPASHIQEEAVPGPDLGDTVSFPVGAHSGMTVHPACTHVVAEGETLAQIAYDHGIPARILMKANGIQRQWCVTRGQRLIICSEKSESNSEYDAYICRSDDGTI
jgi:LysM repeat protein